MNSIHCKWVALFDLKIANLQYTMICSLCINGIFRIRSVGFDMLKQRGNWQATGTEPAHLGMEFDSIFTHEVEEIAGMFVRKSGTPENEARKFLSTAFQVRIRV